LFALNQVYSFHFRETTESDIKPSLLNFM